MRRISNRTLRGITFAMVMGFFLLPTVWNLVRIHKEATALPKPEPKIVTLVKNQKVTVSFANSENLYPEATVTITEVCYNGVVYLMTIDGGITPKINSNSGAYSPYFYCDEKP